jgi:Ca-activated chloride channel homolog
MKRTYPISLWIVWTAVVPGALAVTAVLIVASADRSVLVFDRPDLWWLGSLGAVSALLAMYSAVRRRRALATFASAELGPLLLGRVSAGRQAFRAGLFVLAIGLLAAAIVGPRWDKYLEKQKVYGRDIVVALDVSRSMLARDVTPYRLANAKREIKQQLTERGAFAQSNRLALMAFAGTTSLRLPLTTDTLAFQRKLDEIHVGSVPRGGTAIAEAIRSGVELFARSPEQAERVILLFTDGEDHEGGPVEAAKAAWEGHGIRVFTFGVGDDTSTVGAEVPESLGENKPMLYDGQIVFSKLDVDGLRKIAEAGQGAYFSIGQLFRAVNMIASMKRSELSTEERLRHKPRFQWFLAAAIALLCLETLVREARNVQDDRVIRTWQREETA